MQVQGEKHRQGKNLFQKEKQSPAQVIQQTRFKFFPTCPTISTRLYKPDSPSILVHCPNPIHRDESKCRGNWRETLDVTIRLERVTCTTGNLTPPAVEVHIRENERIVRAEWLRQPQSPRQRRGRYILVIHDTKEQDTLAYPLGKRGVPGTKNSLYKGFYPCQLRRLRVRPLPGEHESLCLQIHEYHTGIITGP